MSDYYTLENNIPIPCDLFVWAQWREEHREDKFIRQEHVGDYWISTVFLGLDHGWGDGPPILFESMVFPTKDGVVTDWGSVTMRRYSTYELALEGHRKLAAQIEAGDTSEWTL